MDRYSSPLGFSSLFAFCGLPLRADPYKGCAFQCTYCFARARESAGGAKGVRPGDPGAVLRQLQRVFVERREDLSVVGECFRQRIPLQLGAMGDPFQPMERRYQVALSYLRAVVAFGYPMVISTRGAMVAEPAYLDVLRSHPAVVVRMSLSTTDDSRSRLLEGPGVRPSQVLRTMERLSAAGIRVHCRWQPFIPGLSEDPEVFAPRVARAGSRQCSFEFLRLSREQNRRLRDGYKRMVGADIYDRYREAGARNQVREYILPAAARLKLILRARDAIRRAGMAFGAADNDFQHLSDSACCCSGVDVVPGFGTYFRHQIAFAVRSSRGGRIEYSSIASEWAPSGSVDRYLSSTRRLSTKVGAQGTVREHVARRWNTTSFEGSPTSFYGVEATDEFSSDGMRVYRWNPEKLAEIGAGQESASPSANR